MRRKVDLSKLPPAESDMVVILLPDGREERFENVGQLSAAYIAQRETLDAMSRAAERVVRKTREAKATNLELDCIHDRFLSFYRDIEGRVHCMAHVLRDLAIELDRLQRVTTEE